jgi:hypothetical protein
MLGEMLHRHERVVRFFRKLEHRSYDDSRSIKSDIIPTFFVVFNSTLFVRLAASPRRQWSKLRV